MFYDFIMSNLSPGVALVVIISGIVCALGDVPSKLYQRATGLHVPHGTVAVIIDSGNVPRILESGVHPCTPFTSQLEDVSWHFEGHTTPIRKFIPTTDMSLTSVVMEFTMKDGSAYRVKVDMRMRITDPVVAATQHRTDAPKVFMKSVVRAMRSGLGSPTFCLENEDSYATLAATVRDTLAKDTSNFFEVTMMDINHLVHDTDGVMVQMASSVIPGDVTWISRGTLRRIELSRLRQDQVAQQRKRILEIDAAHIEAIALHGDHAVEYLLKLDRPHPTQDTSPDTSTITHHN